MSSRFFSLIVSIMLIARPAFAEIKPVPTGDLHRRPLPEIPLTVDIVGHNDVYTWSVATSVHSGLFQYSETPTEPQPDLVKDFSVSPDGRTYDFQLKNRTFHDGSRVTSHDAKLAIEDYIKRRGFNYENFSHIVGYQDFSTKKSGSLSGIEIRGELSFRILLTKPWPEMIQFFAENIVPVTKGPKHEIGAGPYRVVAMDSKRIHLQAVPSALRTGHTMLKEVLIEAAGKDAALKGFQNGMYHDLLMYFLSPEEVSQTNRAGFAHYFRTPRTLFLALNSRVLKDLGTRLRVLTAIDKRSLVKTCFPGEMPTDSIVPRGFHGYSAREMAFAKPPNEKPRQRTVVRIAVDESMQSAPCVAGFLNALRIPGIEMRARLTPTSEWSKEWRKKEIEGAYSLLDAEYPFPFFSPGPTGFGIAKDNEYTELMQRFSWERDYRKRADLVQDLTNRIYGYATFLPIINPSAPMVISKRYQRPDFAFSSPCVVPFTLFVKSPQG